MTELFAGGAGGGLGERWYGARAPDGTFWFFGTSATTARPFATTEASLAGVMSLVVQEPLFACAIFGDETVRCKVPASPTNPVEPTFDALVGLPPSTEVANGCALTTAGAVWTIDTGAASEILGTLVPLPVAAARISSAGSEGSSCAILVDGRLACWGSIVFGPVDESTCPYRECATPLIVPGLDSLVDLDIALGEGCALRADGAVFCWGGTEGSYVPLQVPSAVSVDHISTSGSVHCARTTDGHAACWGDLVGGPTSQMTPEVVPGVDHVVQVVAGGGEGVQLFEATVNVIPYSSVVAYALREDGTVLLIAADQSGFIVQPATQ